MGHHMGLGSSSGSGREGVGVNLYLPSNLSWVLAAPNPQIAKEPPSSDKFRFRDAIS